MSELKDAADIRDDEWLLRRITPSLHTSPQPDGTRILTSYAFRERNAEFSMYVASEITPEKLLSCGLPTQEVIAVSAGEVRALGYEIIREPDECDHSHVYARAKSIKSKGQYIKDCKALAELVNCRKRQQRSEPERSDVKDAAGGGQGN